MNIGQAIVPTLELKRELGVVNAQAVQDGCMEVVDVDGIFGDVVAEFIGRAVCNSGLNSAAGQPIGEDVRIVIPPLPSL